MAANGRSEDEGHHLPFCICWQLWTELGSCPTARGVISQSGRGEGADRGPLRQSASQRRPGRGAAGGQGRQWSDRAAQVGKTRRLGAVTGGQPGEALSDRQGLQTALKTRRGGTDALRRGLPRLTSAAVSGGVGWTQ